MQLSQLEEKKSLPDLFAMWVFVFDTFSSPFALPLRVVPPCLQSAARMIRSDSFVVDLVIYFLSPPLTTDAALRSTHPVPYDYLPDCQLKHDTHAHAFFQMPKAMVIPSLLLFKQRESRSLHKC
jgi:hypothetical protein